MVDTMVLVLQSSKILIDALRASSGILWGRRIGLTQSGQQKPGPMVGGPNPEAVRSRRALGRGTKALHRIGAPLTLGLVRSLWSTYRFRISGGEALEAAATSGQPVVLAFWHEALVVCGWYMQRLIGSGLRPIFVISPSRDGEFAMRMLHYFGGTAVRGSATRSGVQAMRGLYRAVTRDDRSAVIPADGPRGPRRHCKQGAVMLARLAQVPVIPIAFEASPSWRLLTWDRLLFPPPFSRIAIAVGEAMTVPRDIETEELEGERQRLETRLLQLGETALERCR